MKDTTRIQRKAAPAPAPAAPALAPSRGFGPAPEGVHPAVLRPSTGGSPLPPPVQAKMEGALGHDFSNVRVHQGAEAPSIGALAFARGSHVHFAPGQYRPHSADGQRILAHELAHVAQQRAGEVRSPGGAVPINDDARLEGAADAAAARVATGGPVESGAGPVQRLAARGAGPIQRQGDEHEPQKGSVPGSFLGGILSGVVGFPQRQFAGAMRTAGMVGLRGGEARERIAGENRQLRHAGGVVASAVSDPEVRKRLAQLHDAAPQEVRDKLHQGGGTLVGRALGGFMTTKVLTTMLKSNVRTALAGNPRANMAATLVGGLVGARMLTYNLQGMAGDVMETKRKVAAQPGGSILNEMVFGKERDA
jgi:hypothetical protein